LPNEDGEPAGLVTDHQLVPECAGLTVAVVEVATPGNAPTSRPPAVEADTKSAVEPFSISSAALVIPQSRFRVLICDDEEVFRVGLRTLLRSLPQIDVVADTAELSQAVKLSSALAPHLALVSSQFGAAALPLIAALNRDGMRVIIMEADTPRETKWVQVLSAAAYSSVSRGASSVAFLRCVRAALQASG
jgi:CheY-like chemotaxis protein